MLDAVVGAVIMVVATTSLLLAIEISEDAFSAAGRHPLNPDERVLLDGLKDSLEEQERDTALSLQRIDDMEELVINQLPKQYQ